MSLFRILIVEIFDVWRIDFMGLFIGSKRFQYILVAVDYVYKWVDTIAVRTNDHKVVVGFLRQFFFSF